MTARKDHSPQDCFELAAEELGYRPGNLRFECEYTFDSVDFTDRTVLDIGAGDGATSFYAACAGAAAVVSLEPELAGSRGGSGSRFERIRNLIGADNVELRAEPLQSFDADEQRFGVLVSMASINHLNEAACMRLQDDEHARATYLNILSKLADLAAPGAALVVSDCARRNVFGDIGVKNPVAPTIEWQKHQSPQLWAELLGQVGFYRPRIRWRSFNTLRRPGRILLGNRVAAYLLTSSFCLTMERG